jgi:hypothetical protein
MKEASIIGLDLAKRSFQASLSVPGPGQHAIPARVGRGRGWLCARRKESAALVGTDNDATAVTFFAYDSCRASASCAKRTTGVDVKRI